VWISLGNFKGLLVDYLNFFLTKIEKFIFMITAENSDNISKSNQKLEDFKRKHADMEAELKRRIMMLRIKNLRLFLKQME